MSSLLDACCALIKCFEGLRLSPYQNKGDRPTIGFGSTFYENYAPVTLDDPEITEDRACEILSFFASKSLEMVQDEVTVQLSNNQTVALTSFEYNTGHLKGSTLLLKLNDGNAEGAVEEFGRWIHAAGVIDPGLVKRRAQEKQLFLTEDDT